MPPALKAPPAAKSPAAQPAPNAPESAPLVAAPMALFAPPRAAVFAV
jgi:hypothetical protein